MPSISLSAVWKFSRPTAFRWSNTPVSVAKRSGREMWVKDGCTLLENHAISEIARARCTGSVGMSCGAYLAAM